MHNKTEMIIEKMGAESTSDLMWKSRSLSLLESIKNLDIDLRDGALFDRLKDNAHDEALKSFLITVPGWNDACSAARQHIGYLIMEPRRMALDAFGPLG